jgi:hypothetical protein
MSLSERLATANIVPPRFCKIGLILTGTQLSKEDKTTLTEFLDAPEGTHGRLTNSAIASALRAEGFDISNSSVDRHRANVCACARKSN